MSVSKTVEASIPTLYIYIITDGFLFHLDATVKEWKKNVINIRVSCTYSKFILN